MYLCGVHVQVTGHARRAVVLVHGARGSSDSWRCVVPALSCSWRVITLDLPGHGQSVPAPSTPVLAAHAGLVRDVLGVLGVERAAIVGYSMGASVAADFAARYPERTDRVVLIAPKAELGPGSFEPAVLHDYFDRYADRGWSFATGVAPPVPLHAPSLRLAGSPAGTHESPVGRGPEQLAANPVPTLTIRVPHGWGQLPATLVPPLVAFLEAPSVAGSSLPGALPRALPSGPPAQPPVVALPG